MVYHHRQRRHSCIAVPRGGGQDSATSAASEASAAARGPHGPSAVRRSGAVERWASVTGRQSGQQRPREPSGPACGAFARGPTWAFNLFRPTPVNLTALFQSGFTSLACTASRDHVAEARLQVGGRTAHPCISSLGSSMGASSDSPTDSPGDFPAISEKRLLSRS